MTAQASGPPAPAFRNAMRPGMGGFGSVTRAKNAGGAARRIASYFLPYRTRLYVVGAAIFLYTLLGLVGPWLMGLALDQYVGHADASGLPLMAGLMLGAYVAGNGLQAASSWWMASTSQRALKALRRDL